MRVLNVIWAFSTGGIGKLFLNYAKLGDYDPELDIISVCIDLQNCTYDRQPLIDSKVKILSIKNRKDFSWISKLSSVANEYSPNIVFCHGFNGPIIVKLAAMWNHKLKVPMICTYHGLYNPPTDSRKVFTDMINNVQAWIYRRYASKVVLVSNYSGEFLLQKGVPKAKMKVIYNGIPLQTPKVSLVKLSHQGISIGVTGRLDSIKGLNYLIESIPFILKQVNIPFHIYIVGDGPEYEKLLNYANELGVGDYVSFEGYQNNVSSWLASWDIFCLPSLQENHSISLLEAMRAGKAIVCTNVGGNPETVKDGKEALVVPSKDSKALADAIIQQINSADLRTELGRNARRKFEIHFTENIMNKELCKLLKSVTK